jgi:hypothetical protein
MSKRDETLAILRRGRENRHVVDPRQFKLTFDGDEKRREEHIHFLPGLGGGSPVNSFTRHSIKHRDPRLKTRYMQPCGRDFGMSCPACDALGDDVPKSPAWSANITIYNDEWSVPLILEFGVQLADVLEEAIRRGHKPFNLTEKGSFMVLVGEKKGGWGVNYRQSYFEVGGPDLSDAEAEELRTNLHDLTTFPSLPTYEQMKNQLKVFAGIE